MSESKEWLAEQFEWLTENPAGKGLLIALVDDGDRSLGALTLDAIRTRGWFDIEGLLRGDETAEYMEKALTYEQIDTALMIQRLESMLTISMAHNDSSSYLDTDDLVETVGSLLGLDATWWSNGYDPIASASACMGVTESTLCASICGRGNGRTFLCVAIDEP
jgi:hypothetical protein